MSAAGCCAGDARAGETPLVAAGQQACYAQIWLRRGKCHTREELPALTGDVTVTVEGYSALVHGKVGAAAGGWNGRNSCCSILCLLSRAEGANSPSWPRLWKRLFLLVAGQGAQKDFLHLPQVSSRAPPLEIQALQSSLPWEQQAPHQAASSGTSPAPNSPPCPCCRCPPYCQ